TQVSENRLLREPGLQPLRRELLQTALKFYQEFVQERVADPSLQADLGRAYARLALITADIVSPSEALKLGQEAVAIQEQLAQAHSNESEYPRELALSLINLGNWYQGTGQPGQAEAAYQKAVALQARLCATHDDPDDQDYLAKSWN